METNYKNILVISLRKIGDTIIATSGAYLLKKAYPDAKVTMLVRPLGREIVENNPVVDRVMLYSYTHKTTWKEMRQIAKILRAENFDLAIILDNKPRSAMLAWMAGIPRRTGFEKIEFRNLYVKFFYTDLIPVDYEAMQVQQVKNHEIFINRFTGRDDRAQMVPPQISAIQKKKAEALLEPSSRKKIALCVRSACLTKDWPLERFSAVLKRLSGQVEADFYVIGAPADLPILETWQQTTEIPFVLTAGKTTLPELAYFLSRMDLFLTVDTGSAHLAAAMQVPLVVVYGSTSPKKWGPYTKDIINIAPSAECHPCDGTKIKCHQPHCLETIDPDMVVAACIKQLRQQRGTSDELYK